jgi:hypothetical protein
MKNKTMNLKDWKDFKEYINTYDFVDNNNISKDTVLKDLLFGMGLLMDRKKYNFGDGFKKFLTYVSEKINQFNK